MVTASLAAAGAHTPASGVFSASWLILLFPIAGAIVLLGTGKRLNKIGHLIGTAMSLAAFVVAVVLFFSLKAKHGLGRQQDDHLFSWVPVDGFKVDVSLLIDQLSIVFCLLITGVGSLIHIYSIGYMEHDPGRRRFFGYLNLFVASMLLLVIADNYLLLYVGWEGVGLASYLLIAFWYDRPAAATAAKKAFLANRVGDVGLSIAIMLMFTALGTTSFTGVFGSAHSLSHHYATAIGLMLLLGACGKSGQFPLQTWLPDAMEGPTPVSALIHAATMVTAGVYLIARSGPIFDLSPDARTVVTIVGAITLLYGCLCGTSYDDIKKVLAYSTVSQIGYMFLAVGLGPAGYAIAILHLVAHGFFKAGLFLGAGSVMHGMNDRVDMRTYGGLRKVMPVTYVTFLLGYLALIGCPPFSAFWTKDKIIEVAFDKGGVSGDLLGSVALIGAGLTAFYMTRLMCMTFWGQKRWDPDDHPHEAPRTMLGPMVVLAFGSVFGGGLLVLGGALQNWLAPVVGKGAEVGVHTIAPWALTLLTLAVLIGGVGAAYWAFGMKHVPRSRPTLVTPFTKAARKALYADALNENVLALPGTWLMRASVWFDAKAIDGAVGGLAAGIGGTSQRLRRIQTGFVRSYALSFVGGTVALIVAVYLVRLG